MNETSKALRRRLRDPMFASHYFKGHALDIGSGNDPLSAQQRFWSLLTAVDHWDKSDGDAQELPGIPENTYDTVYSSHCLEHVREPEPALLRWYDVLRPGGFLVVAVPDFVMYERGIWPSRHNPDHKTAFDFRGVAETLFRFPDIIKVERIIEGFDPSTDVEVDQTMTGAECSVEFIVRKA